MIIDSFFIFYCCYCGFLMKGVLKMKQVTKEDTKRLLNQLPETYEVVNYV